MPIRRWGFHGASHCFIAGRMSQILAGCGATTDSLRVISCHLGGSSSLCAIRGGVSVANSLGMSPQSGVPHNNRVGDFDPFALPVVLRETGRPLAEVLAELASAGGLLGLSGLSGDVRDLEQAAEAGHEGARLALDVFVTSIRHYLGAYLVELGGADALVFTGGIGENGWRIRQAVCDGLTELGIALDTEANRSAKGESKISADSARVAVWVVPTNEEIIVARQTHELLKG
jgi:acetate kinase